MVERVKASVIDIGLAIADQKMVMSHRRGAARIATGAAVFDQRLTTLMVSFGLVTQDFSKIFSLQFSLDCRRSAPARSCFQDFVISDVVCNDCAQHRTTNSAPPGNTIVSRN